MPVFICSGCAQPKSIVQNSMNTLENVFGVLLFLCMKIKVSVFRCENHNFCWKDFPEQWNTVERCMAVVCIFYCNMCFLVSCFFFPLFHFSVHLKCFRHVQASTEISKAAFETKNSAAWFGSAILECVLCKILLGLECKILHYMHFRFDSMHFGCQKFLYTYRFVSHYKIFEYVLVF